MIKKKVFAELPPRSEYSITETGKTLIPLINQIEKWGDNFRPQMEKILDGVSGGRNPPATL